MGKGPQISPFLATIIIAMVVCVVLIVGWKSIGLRGKTEMPPEAKARMEKALGLPGSGGQPSPMHGSNHP